MVAVGLIRPRRGAEDLADRAVDAVRIGVSLTVERRPSVSRSVADQRPERRQVVGLVGDHEVLVVDPERIGEQLADLRVVVAHAHVLVHRSLADLLGRRYQSADFVNG